MRAAIYTHRRGQLQLLRAHCDSQRWRIVAEYLDEAGRQEAFKQLLTDALDGGFDVLLVQELGELPHRRPLEVFRCIDQLRRWGVMFQSHSEPLFSGPRFASLAGWIAAEDRRAQNVA